jgi:LCP family protein required for cell wall assembly
VFEVKKIGDPVQTKLSLFESSSSSKAVIKKPKKIFRFWLIPVFLFSLWFIFEGAFFVYSFFSDKSFLENMASPLLSGITRDEHGYINVLLLGKDISDSDGLTDTMIIASVDTENKNIVMLSVPRDLWVTTEKFGSSRINEIYRNTKSRLIRAEVQEDIAHEEAVRILQNMLEKVTGIPLHHYAQINFYGLIDIVDALSGIEIENKEAIYDENYPNWEWGYETFELPAGTHILDGETALKFARSRYSTSDFNRAARQQQVIQAIKNKAMSGGILSSPRMMKKFYEILQENFSTSFSLREMMSLGVFFANFPSENMKSYVLNDDWNTPGGFLGVPPRANYGGAYVLIPYSGTEDYSRIQMFTELIFYHRDVLALPIEVLNASNISGRAGLASLRLQRYGFTVNAVANAEENLSRSEVFVYKNFSAFQEIEPLLREIFPISLKDYESYYDETDVSATFFIGGDYQ